MNKTRMLIASLLIAAGGFTAVAQSSDAVLRDKITNAVMKVYDDHLAENPNDYNTLFARAHQQFDNGDYLAALTDVNQAMLLTPKSDKELRFDEHILRSRISIARSDFSSAIADLRLALELEPKSLPCVDLLGKTYLMAGNMTEAEKCFKTILRAESMNYDAMYGLAQVEQGRNNPEAALEHVNKAVALFHAEPQVLVNRADIYARQGNIEAAVADLLQGMMVGNGGQSVQRLFDLSDSHYDTVMKAMSDLANKTNDPGLYRYLRANIAMDHNRYGQALRDLNFVKNNRLYNSDLVYYNIGKCCLELGRYDQALASVEQALSMDASQPEYYLVKALAQYHVGQGGNCDAAMQTLMACSDIAPQYVPMLLTKAAILVKQGKDKEALGYLNAAVANEPGNGEALLSRAMLLSRLGHETLAYKDYSTMAILDDDAADLKGFGLNQLGRDNDALNWLYKVIKAKQPGGENLIYAALFMAQRGDNFKALEYVQQALDSGYGSIYRLMADDLSPVNFSTLRNEPGFQMAIEKAQRNFVESD